MKTYSALGRLLFFCTMLAVEMQGSKPNAIQPCPRDPSAFQRLKQLAEEGRATAQASLADCYEQGRHVSPDGKKAIQWLT